MLLRLFVCMLVALLLHACGGEVQKSAKAGRTHQIAAVSAAPEAPQERPRETEEKAASVLPKAAPEPSFTKAERDPSRLLDLHRADLAAILGKPSFVRKDMSAEVWQYRTDACVLDLFLYEFDKGPAVTYYEFRPRANIEIIGDECFLHLLRRGISRSAKLGS